MIRSSRKTIIVSIACTGLLGVATLFIAMRATLRASNPPTAQRDVWVGDVLPGLPNYTWAEHDHSLVLAARVECPYCKASAPYYRQLQSLVSAATNRVGIIAVFPNPPDKVRAFVEEFHLDMLTVPSTPLERFAVSGTPTLILADSRGAVIRVWVGELDAEEQHDLFARLQSYLGGKGR